MPTQRVLGAAIPAVAQRLLDESPALRHDAAGLQRAATTEVVGWLLRMGASRAGLDPPADARWGTRRWAGEIVGRTVGTLDGADCNSVIPSEVRLAGAVHEAMLGRAIALGMSGGVRTVAVTEDRAARRRTGSFYTPPAVVRDILRAAVEASGGLARGEVPRVLDPSMGTGNFLLGALEEIDPRGEGPGATAVRREIAIHGLHGVDLDPDAVEIARASVWIGARLEGLPLGVLAENLRAGDSLAAEIDGDGASWSWRSAFPRAFDRGGFDLVLGNPPFLSQLARGTARAEREAARLKARFPGLVGAYTDPAAIFLALGMELCRDGGAVAMLLPTSFLSVRDAAAVRACVAKAAALRAIWRPEGELFKDAGVRVCAPVLVKGSAQPRCVRRWGSECGPGAADVEVAPDSLRAGASWAPIVSGGVAILVRSGRTLRDIAHATADFRDQYYGLRGAVVEDGALPPGFDERRFPRLVSTGLVDLAECAWGRRAVRFDRMAWTAPRVGMARLEKDDGMKAWAAARLTPKALLATQTRVLEVVVDDLGEWLPLVPLITITARAGEDLWRIAAAAASPAASAWAWREFYGSGLSSGAIKGSARRLLDAPLPTDEGAWDEGAAAFRAAGGAGERRALLLEFGRAMVSAYALDRASGSELLGWWLGRLDSPRGRPAARLPSNSLS